MAEARQKSRARRAANAFGPALDALSEAVQTGAGLPETARRAAAALGAIVALIDSRGAVLAVAAGSPSEERALLSKEEGVTAIDLRVSESGVGHGRPGSARDRARRARVFARRARRGDRPRP